MSTPELDNLQKSLDQILDEEKKKVMKKRQIVYKSRAPERLGSSNSNKIVFQNGLASKKSFKTVSIKKDEHPNSRPKLIITSRRDQVKNSKPSIIVTTSKYKPKIAKRTSVPQALQFQNKRSKVLVVADSKSSDSSKVQHRSSRGGGFKPNTLSERFAR